jgi:hypothetical protein
MKCRFALPSMFGPRDRGDIVLGWLTKLVVVFGIAGLALFDAISLGTTYVNVADQGSYAAREASEMWASTKDLQKAYDAAVAAATEQNAGNTVDAASFRIDPDGTVHLKVSREATTLVIYRIHAIAKWADIERDESGHAVS